MADPSKGPPAMGFTMPSPLDEAKSVQQAAKSSANNVMGFVKPENASGSPLQVISGSSKTKKKDKKKDKKRSSSVSSGSGEDKLGSKELKKKKEKKKKTKKSSKKSSSDSSSSSSDSD